MLFKDRTDAGIKLSGCLSAYACRENVIVLGIPRGGVVVAYEVANALQAPLEIFVLRKLGVPWQDELAFGAIASGGIRVLDRHVIADTGITQEEIEAVTARELRELERREVAYRGHKAPLSLKELTAVVVDDGIATGSSMRAAIRALHQLKPAGLVIAVPVAPVSTCNSLRAEVDQLICMHELTFFYSIGQFYGDFSQVSDEDVTSLLHQAQQSFAARMGSSKER